MTAIPTAVRSPEELAQELANDYARGWVIEPNALNESATYVVATNWTEDDGFLPPAERAFLVLPSGEVLPGENTYEEYRWRENERRALTEPQPRWPLDEAERERYVEARDDKPEPLRDLDV